MTGLELLVQRRMRGVRQADLAERLGIARPTISYWERNRRAIPPDRVGDIVKALYAPDGAASGRVAQKGR